MRAGQGKPAWPAGSNTSLAVPIAVLLAAGIGLSLQVIQRRVTRFIDRMFFRERYDIEQRLERVARAAPQLSNDAAIVHAVLHEPVEALQLNGGAFYRRTEEGAFELSASIGWVDDAPRQIDAGDPLVLQLAGAGEALSLDGLPHLAMFPHGPIRPRTAVAVPGVNGPHALVFFAAHRSGATLDPDEAAGDRTHCPRRDRRIRTDTCRERGARAPRPPSRDPRRQRSLRGSQYHRDSFARQ